MLDIGWPELMLIAVVALIVIGPKDLPAAIRTVTTIIRKVRGMAAEFQGGLEEIARDSGIDDVKQSVEDVISYDAEAALKNIADFGVSVSVFWALGFGIMFGTSMKGLFGTDSFFFVSDNALNQSFFVFQAMFVATAASIISGVVAERLKFFS